VRATRAAALVAVAVGAAGSVGLMLRVGHRNDSAIPLVLLVLFTGWVLSPFLGLVAVDIASRRWSARTRATLHGVMLIVALGSLAIYGAFAFGPPRPKPAAVFLLVPLGSWLLMAIVVPIAAVVSKRSSLREFATRYTAAWCSGNASSVASFFAANGFLKINEGSPSVGRTAITAAAQGFMTDFPDMVVTMDGIGLDGARAVYRWTLTGTNTGPGGSGMAVRISGYEEWTMGADGLIAESRGHFDQAEYERQLKAGVPRRSPPGR
jgi:SnoaL-like polyketide cyclase